MTIAFVLGNGISRKGIDLNQLRQHGAIYGCNALYREFTPDVLVATDRPIATAIQESGYAQRNVFYTRRPIEGLGARVVPKPYFGYSSGPIAAAIATQDGHALIYLLGFDMGPTVDNRFNNIYAGTEFYKSRDSQPTFSGNWIRQLVRIAQDYPNTEFIRVMGSITASVSQFDTVANIKSLNISLFVDHIIKP